MALQAYEAATGLLKRAKQKVPAELWNNLGALRQRLGKLDSAERAYTYALKASAAAGSPDVFQSLNVTTTFNLARLREEKGHVAKAEASYVGLLQQHPNYIDCFLRLSACAIARGKAAESISWLKRGLEIEPHNADAWCMLGNVYLRERDYSQALILFSSCLQSLLAASLSPNPS